MTDDLIPHSFSVFHHQQKNQWANLIANHNIYTQSNLTTFHNTSSITEKNTTLDKKISQI